MARKGQTQKQAPRAAPWPSDFKTEHLSSCWFDRVCFVGELGEMKRFKRKDTGQFVMQKTYTLNKKEEFDEVIKSVKLWKRIDHPNVGRVLGFEADEKRAYCSTFYSVDVYIEGFSTSLEDYFGILKKDNIISSSESLTVLLANLGEGLAALKKFEVGYKCLSPRHVILDEQNGEIMGAKLVPLPGIIESVYEIARRLVISSSEIIVSPELYDRSSQLFKNELSQQLDIYKIDAFCLGMTILKAGLQENLNSLYSTKRFDRDQLQSLIAIFREFYEDDGELLCSCLSLLLKIDPKERIYAYQLMLKMRGPEESIDDFEIEELIEPEPIDHRKTNKPRNDFIFKQVENPLFKQLKEDFGPRSIPDQNFQAQQVIPSMPRLGRDSLKRDTVSLRELSKGSVKMFSSNSATPEKIADSPKKIDEFVIDLNPTRKKTSLPGRSPHDNTSISPKPLFNQGVSSNTQTIIKALPKKKSQERTAPDTYRPLLPFDTNTVQSSRSNKANSNLKCRMPNSERNHANANQVVIPKKEEGVKKEAVKEIIKSIISKASEMRSSQQKKVAVIQPPKKDKKLPKTTFFSGRTKNLFDETLLQRTLKIKTLGNQNNRKAQNIHRRSKTAENIDDLKKMYQQEATFDKKTYIQGQIQYSSFSNQTLPISHCRKRSEPFCTRIAQQVIDTDHNKFETKSNQSNLLQKVDIKNLLTNIKPGQITSLLKPNHFSKPNMSDLTRYNQTLPLPSSQPFKPIIMPNEEYYGMHSRTTSREMVLKPSYSEGMFIAKPKHVSVIQPETIHHPEIHSTGKEHVHQVALGTIKDIQPRTSHIVRECIRNFNDASAEIRSRSSSAGMNKRHLVQNNQYMSSYRSDGSTLLKHSPSDSIQTKEMVKNNTFNVEKLPRYESQIISHQLSKDFGPLNEEFKTFNSNPGSNEHGFPTATFNSQKDFDLNKNDTMHQPSSNYSSDPLKIFSTQYHSSGRKDNSEVLKFMSFAETHQNNFTFDEEKKLNSLNSNVQKPKNIIIQSEAIQNPISQITDFDTAVIEMKKTLPLQPNAKKQGVSSVSRLAAFMDRQQNPLLRNKSQVNSKVQPSYQNNSGRSQEDQTTLNIGPGQDSMVVIDSRSGSFIESKSKQEKTTKMHTTVHSYFLGPKTGFNTRETSPQEFGGLYKVGSSVSREMSIREMSYHNDWKDKDSSFMPFVEREGVDPLGFVTPSGFETRRVSLDVPKRLSKEDDFQPTPMKTLENDSRETIKDGRKTFSTKRESLHNQVQERTIVDEDVNNYESINRRINKSESKPALEQSLSGRKRVIFDIEESTKPSIQLGVLQINYASNSTNKEERVQNIPAKGGKNVHYSSVGVQTEDTRDEQPRTDSSRGFYGLVDPHLKQGNYDSVETLNKHRIGKYESQGMAIKASQQSSLLKESERVERDTVERRASIDHEIIGKHFTKRRNNDLDEKKNSERRGRDS